MGKFIDLEKKVVVLLKGLNYPVLQQTYVPEVKLLVWPWGYVSKLFSFKIFSFIRPDDGKFRINYKVGPKTSSYVRVTLPETNIAPENKPLEKEIPIGNHHF